MSEKLSVVVLAAGKGTRMRSPLRKVLHPLAGRPMIAHMLAAVAELEPDTTLMVLAPGMEDVLEASRKTIPNAKMAVQDPPQGTGHAVQVAADALPQDGHVMVVFGDTPLLTGSTLRLLWDHAKATSAAVTVLGMRPPDPTGYGRLKVEGDRLTAIIEHAHADDDLRNNAPCNSGVMIFDATKIHELLDHLPFIEGKGEYYLTDAIGLAIDRGWHCATIDGPWQEGMGVNSQAHLAEAHELFQVRARTALLDQGVIMPAPDTVHLAFDTLIEPGAMIEPFVVFGPGAVVRANAIVRSHSHIEGAIVGESAVIGPFARLRPGTNLARGSKVGNFVETKNAKVGEGSKINHLSYVGDAVLGTKVNVGAGTITCNYDGFNKHQTQLADNVFIGSNTALVAPVTIGEGALVGAGSTITRDVASDDLAIERSKQENRKGMGKEVKRRLEQKKNRDKK